MITGPTDSERMITQPATRYGVVSPESTAYEHGRCTGRENLLKPRIIAGVLRRHIHEAGAQPALQRLGYAPDVVKMIMHQHRLHGQPPRVRPHRSPHPLRLHTPSAPNTATPGPGGSVVGGSIPSA